MDYNSLVCNAPQRYRDTLRMSGKIEKEPNVEALQELPIRILVVEHDPT